MRTLTKYILREVASHAAIGTAVFTFIIFMRDLGRILELVVRNSAPLPAVIEVFAYTIPTALIVTLPMGVLVGILIGLSRLAADSEITAMRAAGLGAWSFVRMVALFVLAAWGLALFNNVIVAPRSAAALSRLQDELKASQASFEVQPRVFYEDFRNYVLYVQDSTAAPGAAIWRGVFLADVSDRSAPKVTLAREGLVLSESPDSLRLHLTDGSQHETPPRRAEQYQISTFQESDVPITLPMPDRSQRNVRLAERYTGEVLVESRNDPDAGKRRAAAIEFHRRFAFPTACFVLSLVGIPLGLSSRRGGKSTGFVLTVALVFIYYFAFLTGMSLARQGRIPPSIGMWMANGVFLLAGLVLLWRVDRMPIEIGSVRNLGAALRRIPRSLASKISRARPVDHNGEDHVARPGGLGGRFPLILDDLVLRNFAFFLGLILASFLILLLIFTYFELLKDILANRVPVLVWGEYLVMLIPYLVYNMTPMAVLLAVLVTFGVMERANEVTAMKATGISVYRIVAPILVIAWLIAIALFVSDQWYLPQANKRQDALRNQIKGKPAQTYVRPDRKWIFGQQSTIFYYDFYEPDHNQFGNISVFKFDPETFALQKRIYAQRAAWDQNLKKWVFANGWDRSFDGPAIESYRTFDVSTFNEVTEQPEYFKKEIKQSSEMDFGELSAYIQDLQQSGFETVRLRVQLHRKIAYPVIALVMAVLAIPFALSTGRRGAAAGVATAVLIAVAYFVANGLFEALGNSNQLPAAVAAWAPTAIFAAAGGYMILKVPT